VVDKLDLDGACRAAERILVRAGAHSRLWVAFWLGSILLVTAVSAISHAPTAAYVILAIVAVAALFADGRSGGSL
jgi:hypothetical protein